MRCFVTGATGFVGSAVTRLLVEMGIPTAVLIRETSSTSRIARQLASLDVYRGDIVDTRQLESSIAQFKPDTILHLGWAGVSAGERNDLVQLENHLASLRLIELAAKYSVRTVIGIGSQAEYGPKESLISELSHCQPNSLYGAAKLATAMIGLQLCRQHEMRFVWLRLFSCYGPGDHADAMIPSLINSLMSDVRPSLTQGIQKWDYLFVEDAADAIVHSAITDAVEGVYNLGSGIALELRTIIEFIRDQINPSLALGFGEIPYSKNANLHLQADIRRLQVTGWSPQTSIEQGIQRTLDWYRSQRYYESN